MGAKRGNKFSHKHQFNSLDITRKYNYCYNIGKPSLLGLLVEIKINICTNYWYILLFIDTLHDATLCQYKVNDGYIEKKNYDIF